MDFNTLSDDDLRKASDSLGYKPEKIDQSEGAGFIDRVKSGFLSKPEEKAAYFKSVYGPENVRTGEDGETLLRNPKSKNWHPIDEKGLSWADLADLVSDIPSMAGMGVGGVLGLAGGPVGAAAGAGAGAAAGNLVKQGIGAMMPGSQERDVLDRAKEAGIEGLVGAGTEATFGALKALKPTDVLSRYLAKKIENDGGKTFAKESQQLSNDTGISLRASQESQNPDIALMEGFASRNPFGKTIFEKAEVKNQDVAQKRLESLIAESGGQLDKPGFGQSIVDTAGLAMSNLIDARKKAGETFKLLDTAAGGKPIFQLNAFKDYLTDEGKRFMTPGMPENARKYGAELLKEAQQFPNGMTSARGMQDMLARYGDIAYGRTGSKLFKDLDSASERRVASGAFKALQQDLDRTANFGAAISPDGVQPLPQGLARLLKATRDEYSSASKNISEFENNTIIKLLDKDNGQNFTNIGEWLPKQNPEAIRKTMALLEKTKPEIRDDVVRSALTDALNAGKVDAPIPFDMKKAMGSLPQSDAARKALFEGHIKSKEIEDLFQVIERASWKPPGQGLPQSPLHMLISSAKAMFGGNFANMGVGVLAPRLIAKWATDPEYRATLKIALTAKGARQEAAQKSLLESIRGRGAAIMNYESISSPMLPSDPRMKK